MRLAGLVCLALYVGTIFAANWAITRYGLVTVAPGLVAPAGVYFAGLAFTLRDLTQNLLGRRWVVAAILAGAAASWVVSSSFAIASAVAFLISETADFLVYTPLARRGWTIAATCGAVVGAAIDSLIFLQLAFHDLSFWKGQFVGKLEMALVAILIWALVERWVRSSGGQILAEPG